MSVYTLFQNLSAVQALPPQGVAGPPGSNLPSGSQMADMHTGGALTQVQPPTNQAFQLVVTGPSATVVSATATILGSNDGINWGSIGTITAAAAVQPNIQTGSGTVPWAYFSAYLTAISGTGAKATLSMNA